jgi:hypothetical protein
MARACRDDLPDKQSEEFFVTGLDRFFVICPSGSFRVSKVALSNEFGPMSLGHALIK